MKSARVSDYRSDRLQDREMKESDLRLRDVVSVGRGGRGNMRGRQETRVEHIDSELDVVPLESKASTLNREGTDTVVSVGRGGFGNVSSGKVEKERSRSRSEKREVMGIKPVYSVGRGGLGNINTNVQPPETIAEHVGKPNMWEKAKRKLFK